MSANVSVTVASGDALDVRDFNVEEKLSELFSIRLTAVCDNPDIDFESVIGQEASFRLEGHGGPRTWTGLASELHQVRVEPEGVSTYHVVVVPTLWLATQRRNHRMFQIKTELEIVEALLGEWGIDFEETISSTYKTRKYRVQYGESDFDFICRMLEEAGITFYFEEKDGASKLVLSDAPQGNELRQPPITFRDTPTVADKEHVTAVSIGRRVRPGKYTMRDVDHRRPAAYPLLATANGAGGTVGVEKKLERFHYTPGAFLFESEQGGDTPFADDRAEHRTDEVEGQKLAQKRLAAQRGDAASASFVTNVIDLSPGTVMSMFDHPSRVLADGKRLLVVESRIDGARNEEWSHHVVVRGADQPYRPELRTPRPRAHGVESATVVGHPGEEIHTDEFGRVRVHFHWDRESKMDNNSSCWIPVSQPWGGAGYGGSNLPRVGQEVLVDFLGGDPDRPMITGRVYTNLQKTPYKLPVHKTQSGWKSNSSPSTGGYNEIMFEDNAGKELVRMQAEKNLHKLVKHDEAVTIGHDRSKQVGCDDSLNVGHDRTASIGHDDELTVGHDATRLVLNNAREVIGMNRARAVGVDETVEIGENQTVSVGQRAELVCGKSRIVLEASGKVTIEGVEIVVTGSTRVEIDGGTVKIVGDPIDLN